MTYINALAICSLIIFLWSGVIEYAEGQISDNTSVESEYISLLNKVKSSVDILSLNIDKILTEKDNDTFDWQIVINAFTAGGGILAVFIGLASYRNSQSLRKKDVLKDIILPLISEFDSEKLKLAKDVLDDVIIKGAQTTEFSDGNYSKKNLDVILEPKNQFLQNKTVSDIRNSINNLLNFVVKLEYLLTVKILSEDEIIYFKPYINKIRDNEILKNYIKSQSIPLRGNIDINLSFVR
jgi:hypothetical protein